MTIDEILNGKLEQEIRQGMLRLEEHAPKNAKPCIAIQVRGFGSAHGFVSADFDGVELGAAGFGQRSVTEAVNAVINALSSPAAIEKRKKDIIQKIDTLQTELQTLNIIEPLVAMES